MFRAFTLALVAAFGLAGCGGASKPAVAYPGRLLVLNGVSDPLTLLQFKSGSSDAASRDTTALSGDRFAAAYLRAASPDGALFVTDDGTLTGSGGNTIGTLPDWKGRVSLGLVSSVGFSPDGRGIAYVGDDKLFLYDVETKTDKVLLATPCATYYQNVPLPGGAPAGGGSSTICGELKSAIWIDSTTLFVHHFAGQFPETISCWTGAEGTGAGCPKLAADTFSVVTTGGQITVSGPASGNSEPVLGRANTVVFEDDTWIDLADVRTGSTSAHRLPPRALRSCLSPDGHRVLVPYPWRMVDIDTGAVQNLGTPDWEKDQRIVYEQCLWSPDGQFMAVQEGGSIYVIPASAAEGGYAGNAGDGAQLIGWAP